VITVKAVEVTILFLAQRRSFT